MNEQRKKVSSSNTTGFGRLIVMTASSWAGAVGGLFRALAGSMRSRLSLWWQTSGRKMVAKGFVRLAVVAVFSVMAAGLVNYSYRMYSLRQPWGRPSLEQEIALDLSATMPEPVDEKREETAAVKEETEPRLSGHITLGPPADELFAGRGSVSPDEEIEALAAAVGSRQHLPGEADGATARPQVNPANMIWPVSGQVAVGYGWVRHPVYRDWRFHPGIELTTAPNAQVAAVMDGRVRQVQSQRTEGLSVTVDHGDGWETTYRGLSQLLVREGTVVRRGQVIGTTGPGTSGQTGRLLFEIRHGDTPLDPRMYLP